MMSTKTNYIDYKLIANIKKGDLLGYFLPSKISDLAYSIETLVEIIEELMFLSRFWGNARRRKDKNLDPKKCEAS